MRKLFERNWQYTFDIHDEWIAFDDFDMDDDTQLDELREEDPAFAQVYQDFINKLTHYKDSIDLDDGGELERIIMAFGDVIELYDFNQIMEELFDYCDQYNIWIKTQFA